MGWTKREFIVQGFEEVGLADYVFDLQPEQLLGGLRRLDSMMATWSGKGIKIGYPLPSSPSSSDIDAETEVPDSANEAIYLNLAIRIGPALGKVIPIELKAAAKAAYNALLSNSINVIEQRLPTSLPLGAGNKTIDNEFVRPEDNGVITSPKNKVEFLP